MNAVEFQTELKPDQTLLVPADVARNIPAGQSVRVIVLFGQTESDVDWERSVTTEFGGGYADSDAIYDQLSER
ncbi:MAG: hypothetical protein ACJ8C4_22010 [Gemmataceae bacterium]